jgi:hypothetical protein
MHLMWIGLGIVAAAFLIIVGLVWLERIAKDREDDGR